MQSSGERGYDGVQTFSSTKVAQRERLGEDVTAWLRAHPDRVPVEAIVEQSSDKRFHCFTIVIFWRIAGT